MIPYRNLELFTILGHKIYHCLDYSFEQIEKVYQDRFKDASDFEFFIVGDIKKQDLDPLLKK